MRRAIKILGRVGALALAMAAGAGLWAQAPASPAGEAAQGFSLPVFISEVSLFLPPELLRPSGAGDFGGGGAGGPGGQAGAQGQARPQLQFTRDPKLYLTKDQVDALQPLAAGLKDNPMPSPSKARQLKSDLEALLSPAQKAEYADFQKAIAKFRAEMQKQRSASGQPSPDLRGMSDQQRQAYIDSLPPDQRQRFQDRAKQQGAGLSQLQRRQRMAEIFQKALEDYRKQLG